MGFRVLVTGADGFVGQKLCGLLEEKGHDVVRSTIVERRGWITCDFNSQEQIHSLVEQAGAITHTVHLAAHTFVPESIRLPHETINVNLNGTIHLVQALSRQHPECTLLFVGSSEVYGTPQQLPIDETHPLNPGNPYAISKGAADQYCQFVSASDGLPIIRVRPFNHSGPGQPDSFVLSSFAHQIARIEKGKQDPKIYVGNLEGARDFSHVADVVQAYVRLLDKGTAGDVYNVASGASHTIQEALDYFLDQSTEDITIEVDPDRYRPTAVKEIRGDSSKLRQATGWNATRSFHVILDDLLEYWREHA
jgi:GDP-4-dehydro-6-deoxy-D-mannose reductase